MTKDEAAKRSYFPQLPGNVWWQLRRRFLQSLPTEVADGYLVTVLNVKPEAARAYLAELKLIGLVDKDGRTTPLARQWRDDSEYGEVCKVIREKIYPGELLHAAPPPNPNRSDVVRWFLHKAGLGQGAANNKAAFYLLLCSSSPADEVKGRAAKPSTEGTGGATRVPRRSEAKPASRNSEAQTSVGQPSPVAAMPSPPARGGGGGAQISPALQLNIEVHISADSTVQQIEAIFASMAKHLAVGRQ